MGTLRKLFDLVEVSCTKKRPCPNALPSMPSKTFWFSDFFYITMDIPHIGLPLISVKGHARGLYLCVCFIAILIIIIAITLAAARPQSLGYKQNKLASNNPHHESIYQGSLKLHWMYWLCMGSALNVHWLYIEFVFVCNKLRPLYQVQPSYVRVKSPSLSLSLVSLYIHIYNI